MQPENPRSGRRLLITVGGVVAGALAIVGGGFLVAGLLGGENPPEADVANAVQPNSAAKDVTESFLAAARDGDCDRAYSFVKQPERFPGLMEEALFKEQVCAEAPEAAARTTVVQQGADRAKVRAEAGGVHYIYEVEKVGRQWKIDPLASSHVEQ